jgi:signal transduction histidine kinase
MNLPRLPRALMIGGILSGGSLLAEVVLYFQLKSGVNAVAAVNLIASLPFVAILFGGGYWLSRGDISPERYRRIAAWVLAGLTFLGGFFLFIAILGSEGLLGVYVRIRWGALAGAGGGTLVGIFEARAIERAVISEQTRIRNEELQRKNEQLKEFAGILTHDLRNPLNVANGYIELLRDKYEDDDFDRVEKSHARMERLSIRHSLLPGVVTWLRIPNQYSSTSWLIGAGRMSQQRMRR